jgi:hypothetical protein
MTPFRLPSPLSGPHRPLLERSWTNSSQITKHLEDADLFLTACGLGGYTDGTLSYPGINEPIAQANWHSNDKLAAALLFSTIKKTEWEFLDRKLGAKACWDTLMTRHQHQGPMRQVNFLQEAMATKFSHSTPLPITAEKVCSAVDRAYDRWMFMLVSIYILLVYIEHTFKNLAIIKYILYYFEQFKYFSTS